MRIKRLDITGFKSFMDRSVFTFDDGVTGIVGPNGCGKSNVVDSIRWVMGEQSAKNLRGRGMEDVIFNGSETKQALSMAEVSLTFKIENGDQLAPQYAGFSEVTVTRRLFRSGESEYLINKAICRLLDITELFLGTGVGTRAYSIIEQGRVGLIVSAKPEDRRAFIEEAAGVTKYKARRRAAERKMELTEQNLLRVKDIVTELEKRLDSLDRQAKKAEKYRKLRAEIREIELHQSSHRYLELLAGKKVLQAKLEELSTEEQAALTQVHSLEETVTARRTQHEAEALELQRIQGEVHQLETQVQRDAQDVGHWTQDVEATRARISQGEEELSALKERLEQLAKDVAAREEELAQISSNTKDDEVALNVAQEELRRTTQLQSEVALRLEQERTALVALAGRLANHESNLLNLAKAKGDLEARRAKNRAEVDTLRQEESKLEAARTDVANRVTLTRSLALELAERKGVEEATLSQTQQAFAENEIQVIAAREALTDKRSRLHSLEEIQRNYEGFDRGVRAVMLKVGSAAKEQGVWGLVADVVSTTPRFEKALEAALGERLQHVIVEHREKGLELVEYLKSMSEGRSSFLPMDLIRPPLLQEPDLQQPGVLGQAMNEIRCEDTVRPVIQTLLGDVVILEDLASARAYAQNGGAAFTLVTLDGEVLKSDGSVVGGVLEGPAVGALQKKREISELAEEVGKAEVLYNEILTRHYTLQKQMGQTEGVLKGLSKNHHAEELNLATQEKDLHKAGEDLAKLRERIHALDDEDGQFGRSLDALLLEEESSRGEVAHAQADKDSREERLRQLSAELDSLRHKGEGLSTKVTTLRVKLAAFIERADAARKELEAFRLSQSEGLERSERLDETLVENRSHVETLSEQISAAVERREQSAARLEELTSGLTQRREAHAEESVSLRGQDSEVKELRARLEELTQGLAELSLKDRELALELSHLVEQIRERHQTELAHELHNYHWRRRLEASSETRLKDLKGQVDRMGEINLTAIEEHAELSKRFDFLSGQKSDLENSMDQLRQAIAKIDKTSRERFEETFAVVNEKFQQVFPRLFGGGRAGLILTEAPPGGEAGVEIVAQPPGKKLQSVTLLSGGEKALTAVSLIFAIFLIKPTPFCLLDEVDAPLDEANVGRYNDMVREMSQQSQFIIITHNKRTMEVSDTLYGVTMEEPGISKLVSVKLKEALPAANENVA
jgi:chromosome segregation protein